MKIQKLSIILSMLFFSYVYFLPKIYAQDNQENGYESSYEASYATATPTPTPTVTPTPSPISLVGAKNNVVNFSMSIPATPTINPTTPNPTCSGNNPVVSFTYSSTGAQWYKVFSDDSSSVPLYSGTSTSFSETLAPSYNGRTSYHYRIVAYAMSNPTSSDVGSSATTGPIDFDPTCYYSVSGIIFVDINRDGTKQPSENIYTASAITMSLTGQPNQDTVNGAYSFGDLVGGSYTIQIGTLPTNYVLTPTQNSSYALTLSGNTTVNFGIVPVNIIPTAGIPTPSPQVPTPTVLPTTQPTPTLPPAGTGGIVFLDYDRSSTYSLNDVLYSYTPRATITLSGTLTYGNPSFSSQTASTTNNGTYSFPNPLTAYLYEGTYTTSLTSPATFPGTNPARYKATTATSKTFGLPPDTPGGSFGMTPLYKISGKVFDDYSKNGIYNSGEPGMSGKQIQISGPVNMTLTTDSNGDYSTGTTLYEGQYTVEFISDTPDGYRITNPPSCPGGNCSFTVSVGRDPSAAHCLSTNLPTGASCANAGFPFTAFDIQDLSFGWTNCNPWFQVIGSNGRMSGSGGFSDPIPASAIAGCGGANASTANPPGQTTPGIIFSSGTPDFGEGQSSTLHWQVEDTYDPAVNRTSYGYMLTTMQQSGITPTPLTSVCPDLSNCSLTNINSGIYKADSSVIFTQSAIKAGASIVIIVTGDARFSDTVTAVSCSAFVLSVSGDIYVSSTVGGVYNDPTSHITGLLSADDSFIIEGTNTSCASGATPDKRLNITGSVVVDAAGTGNGSIQNHRDLGDKNRSCPSLTVSPRLDMLLCAPEFIKHKADVWQEVAP